MGSLHIPAPVPLAWHPGRLFPARAALAEVLCLGRIPRRLPAEAADESCGLAGLGFDAGESAGAWNLLISICSDRASRLHAGIPLLAADLRARGHSVRWVHEAEELEGGDICFFLGYARGLDFELAGLHTHNLLVSESALDGERGRIPVRLLAADATVEGGLRQLEEFFLPRRANASDPSSCDGVRRLCLSFVKRYPDSLLGDLRRY